MFTQALKTISKDDSLPKHVKEALYQSRLRIRDGDSTVELYKILFSTCLRALPETFRTQGQRAMQAREGDFATHYSPDWYVRSVTSAAAAA